MAWNRHRADGPTEALRVDGVGARNLISTQVVPDYSWGTLPVHLQKRYTAYDCVSLVPPVPDAAPTETVRRGWNRTAGSRYAFAADGVTYESDDGI